MRSLRNTNQIRRESNKLQNQQKERIYQRNRNLNLSEVEHQNREEMPFLGLIKNLKKLNESEKFSSILSSKPS